MALISAIKKLYKRKNYKDCYNSDYVLTVKEKKTILTFSFLLIFPFIIAAVIIAINSFNL